MGEKLRAVVAPGYSGVVGARERFLVSRFLSTVHNPRSGQINRSTLEGVWPGWNREEIGGHHAFHGVYRERLCVAS
jgi:hypothetical protein